ncbi:pyridoxamine 5'-phosphate oxidase family protein [Arachnia propionica]|uniref:Pyridoxamine 5'-phosphate oxidase family protein n=1 Tax=Arachnia propionica TaxID=1750 RepID=A0A3P1T6V3_9ACTN|nr:pyridoxamine 5'-phosphate oxidase family protein [Arachnia propionica]MDO5083466.1 pyridoxamine 5'-phosphate oxidase family protein [Arachnia propionica]RRD04905.1 pyridoxamine 5'-phosphate oxidase family protein [Arachnia propionica]
MTDVTYFERLERSECLRLLAGHEVGRVAWWTDEGPTILPVNYHLVGEDLVFHTHPTSPLARLVVPGQVAFQVDDIDVAAAIGWSVLVRGTSGPSDDERSSSFLPDPPGLGVAIRIHTVEGRVLSGIVKGERDE